MGAQTPKQKMKIGKYRTEKKRMAVTGGAQSRPGCRIIIIIVRIMAGREVRIKVVIVLIGEIKIVVIIGMEEIGDKPEVGVTKEVQEVLVEVSPFVLQLNQALLINPATIHLSLTVLVISLNPSSVS